MKDYEKAIEEAAKVYAKYSKESLDVETFVAGAKSKAAKEFHQQGMYSEEEVEILLNRAFGDIGYGITIDSYPDGTLQQARGLNKWFMQNKKK